MGEKMIIIGLLRLFTGYVCFRAENGFPERFVNLCSNQGVPLWDLRRQGGTTFACTTIQGYLQIKTCAVRSGMRLQIINKRGLPFFLHKYRRRAGLLCGLAFFFVAIGVLSAMVWTIDISGNNLVTTEQVLDVLAEAGLKTGTFGRKIDAPKIRFYALSHLPDVTYITVNRVGSSVYVEVTERVENPVLPSKDDPCDVVSAVEGQLAVIEVYEGTKLHSPGEAVMCGEVLAGGFVELRDGSVRFRHAEAYAVVRTSLTVEAKVDKIQPTLVQTGEQKKITVQLFGFDIPLPGDEPTEPFLTRRHCLCIGGVNLPFGYTVRLGRSYEKKERKPDKNELALDIAEKYLTEKNRILGGSDICEENFSADENADGVAAHGEFLAEVSAGISREMMIE